MLPRYRHRAVRSAGYQYNGIDLTYERSKDREITLDMDFDDPTMQLTYIFK